MTLAHQRNSSSTFIAHLLVQQYPPKVQPQSSSARDHALFGHLDKVDAEAGCILIALANHDKRKDLNDLLPYSIRVIDYNQTTTHNTTLDGSLSSSSSSSSSSSDSSSSSSSPSESTSPHTDSEDPITSTEKPDYGDGGTMSIKNLLGMNGKHISSSVTDTPPLSGMTDPPSNTDQSSLSSSTTTKIHTTTSQSSHNDINDQQKNQQILKRKPRTDPILLLAAAAKAIDQDEQLQQQQQQRARQKRKYSDDESSMDSRSHSTRPRHHGEGQATAFDQRQSEKSKFSYQYLSMKQNPKIKRNAMHAYITYMIYTDLASSDKMYHQDKDTHHQSTTAAPVAPLPPLPPQATTTTTTMAATTQTSSSYPLPASPYPTLTSTSTNQRTSMPTTASSSSPALPMTFDQQQYAQRSSYSPRINIPTTGTTGTNASSSETHPWPYGLISSSSSPPPPPPLLPSGGSTNRVTGNSSIMARPLTAFLRDDMYT